MLGGMGGGGTTSACAENTFGAGAYLFATRNYLRVRGEYQHAKDLGNDESELPPRARRIPISGGDCDTHGGTTSACAENTLRCAPLLGCVGNYLRVRGEYALRCPGGSE